MARQKETGVNLLGDLLARPDGRISPSVYETGRLVALAPWLPGHRDRWEFLLRAQNPDGTWGGPDEYGLVPTLSATEAILTSARRDHPDRARWERLTRAADAGLRALAGNGRPARLPDTVAVELIVPDLVERLAEHLPAGALPALDPALLVKVRSAVRAGAAIPTKLLHSLEVVGAPASGAPTVRPVGGAVGCSPAATVTWLGEDRQPDCVAYLEALVARHGGPVPSVVPITVFERAWVVAELVRAGMAAAVPVGLIDSLDTAVADGATAGAPGLPPDADTTGATLTTLARLGRPRSHDCLFDYELDTHFCCWHGEKTPSPTANAHVLEAFAEQPGTARARAAITKIAAWLADCQLEDGSWTDKWHSSPYYATACCVPALDHTGDPRSRAAVRRAVDWVLGTQRPDGSWGRWAGTAEETAYAVQVLLHARTPFARTALSRANTFLLDHSGRFDLVPLWQDKDLYCPTAVVETTIRATMTRLDDRLASQIERTGS
jgi:hypothetical protein